MKRLTLIFICALLMNLSACYTRYSATPEKSNRDTTSPLIASESLSLSKEPTVAETSEEERTVCEDSIPPVENAEVSPDPNKETTDHNASRREGGNAFAEDSPARKPTEPLEKLTGPFSSVKPKEPEAEKPASTESCPTEPEPTEEPEPTGTEPAETEPPAPTSFYIIQTAMDYGNAYAQSLGFSINYALTPAGASYWPPDEQTDSSIAKYGGQAYLNGRVKQCVDAIYDWMEYEHEQAPDNPNYIPSNIPVRVFIEYRYTDDARGAVYWIYVLS